MMRHLVAWASRPRICKKSEGGTPTPQKSEMKLAFSTNAYTRFTLEQAIRGIRRAGFDGVEILADVPHAYPDAMNDALVQLVRRTLDETGMAISSIHCIGI